MSETKVFHTDEALMHAQALPAGACLLLLGASDTGKTTWVTQAVQTLTRSGKTVAILDCDLGQSEIGLPGTIGVALAKPEGPRALRDLPLLTSYFIGATSPARHALPWCVGACQLARLAREHHPDLLIIDTCGWVLGGAAVQAKQCLTGLLLPQTVYAFTRGHELDPLLRTFDHFSTPDVHRIEPAPEVGRKSPVTRSTRRMARFQAGLEKAKEITLGWDDVALLGTRLGLGEPVAHHVQQFVTQSLHVPVLHAEVLAGQGLYVVVNGERWNTAGLSILENYFRTSQVHIVAAQKFAGLYVGLVDAQGVLLDIGIVGRLDFARRTLTLHTPCKRPAAVAQVWMGSLRLRLDGREKGETRPNEL